MPSGRAISRNCARCAVSSLAALMDGLQRRAGELELSARLERDRAAAGHIGKADDVRPVHDRLPAEQMLHADEQRADRAAALVGHRLAGIGGERELLVLGAGPPLRFRFRAFGKPRDELVARFDWRQVDNVTGHLRDCPEGRGGTLHEVRARATPLGFRYEAFVFVGRAKERSDVPAASVDGGHASLCPPYGHEKTFSRCVRTRGMPIALPETKGAERRETRALAIGALGGGEPPCTPRMVCETIRGGVLHSLRSECAPPGAPLAALRHRQRCFGPGPRFLHRASCDAVSQLLAGGP